MRAILWFFRDLYSGPVQAALVFSFTLVAAVTIGVGAWVISVTINGYLAEVMDERIARDIHLAETFYNAKLREIDGITTRLSLNTTVDENIQAASKGDVDSIQVLDKAITQMSRGVALGGNHFIAVMDAEGSILAGQIVTAGGDQHTITSGGSWADLPIVRTSLVKKTPVVSTEIIPRELLQQIGLAEQAHIDLVDTPRAAPELYDPREGAAGLALVSVSPVWVDGDVAGLAFAFHMFNNDFALVDQIRDAAQIDTVTIFMGDLRVSTNVMTAEGSRAVGTRVSQEVGDVVLLGGREYVGTAFVVDQDYITRYEPLRDHDGRIIGILYVGVRQASFFRLLTTFDQRITIVAISTILMTFILATPVSRLITQPLKDLRELVKTSHRVANGDLIARAPVTARGEVGLVSKSFNTMLDTLQSTQNQLVRSEKLASLGQLAAGVAHELNNPLGTILLYAETMMGECSEDDPSCEDLKMIISETKRCKRIVSDLLNFARQSPIISQPTDIHAVIQELIEATSRLLKDSPIVFKIELASDLPIIEGDATQLRQVFLNMMGNAIEAMPEGGTLTIRTRSEPPDMVTIEFQDTGVGIPPEYLRKIFTPFHTTKPIGKGTGLGLSIVYGIVKMHRGQINVQSRPGEGATFTISLPIRRPATENRPALTQAADGDNHLIG
ncbi:MAG: cache domain-containing protein [Anaerolineae bacterium]|nr:cache domain-containing protein [Anaerolineae bacterium]